MLNMLKVQTTDRMIAGTSAGFSDGSVIDAELLPARRAVDPRRLVEVGRDRLQGAEGDHHHEREAEPAVGRAAPSKNDVNGFSNQRDRLAAEHLDDLVHDAELLVEHPLPDQRGDVVRHRPGQDQQHPVDRPEREALGVQDQREDQPDRDADRRRW